MKEVLFQVPMFYYQISKWKSKKRKLLKLLKDYPVSPKKNQFFLTNRQGPRKNLTTKFCEIFKPELEQFSKDTQRDVAVHEVWSIQYHQHDYQITHNHGSTGYSGLLYVNYNPKKHRANTYMQPWNHIESNDSVFNRPPVKEGTLVIVPSFINHFVIPNQSNELREVIGFDMKTGRLDRGYSKWEGF
jgi:hypothetical protein